MSKAFMTALEAVLRTLDEAGLNYSVKRDTQYMVLFQVDGRRYRVPVSISEWFDTLAAIA
jgi:hypothetical protein